jgi:multicomponent Na+:H+ antiporter subunit G
MNPIALALIALGSAVAVLAGVGLLRFTTPYARFHAAGKASPVSFLLVAAGAGIELGLGASARLSVAAVALVLTLPVGVHLLFRAVHRTTSGTHLTVDELAPAERWPHNSRSGS